MHVRGVDVVGTVKQRYEDIIKWKHAPFRIVCDNYIVHVSDVVQTAIDAWDRGVMNSMPLCEYLDKIFSPGK